MITCEVNYTTSEITTTRRGNRALLVSYWTDHEVIREWLFADSDALKRWWRARTDLALPGSIAEAVWLHTRGRLKPTTVVSFERDGKWTKVKRTEVGDYPTEVTRFMKEVVEIFGEVDLVSVRL